MELVGDRVLEMAHEVRTAEVARRVTWRQVSLEDEFSASAFAGFVAYPDFSVVNRREDVLPGIGFIPALGFINSSLFSYHIITRGQILPVIHTSEIASKHI